MNKFIRFATFGFGVIAFGFIWFTLVRNWDKEETIINSPTNIMRMKIASPAFADNQTIPAKYTCDGHDVNPPLQISKVPQDAQSLALIVHDPDAPVEGGWTHWVLWNISPTLTLIPENSTPDGAVQGKTSSGQNVYGGPCPPSGTHRYFFKLYALNDLINPPSYSTAADLEKAIEGHIISQAQLIGLYNRK